MPSDAVNAPYELGSLLLTACFLVVTTQGVMRVVDYLHWSWTKDILRSILTTVDNPELWSAEDQADPLYVEARRLLVCLLGRYEFGNLDTIASVLRHVSTGLLTREAMLEPTTPRVTGQRERLLRDVFGFVEDQLAYRKAFRLLSFFGTLSVAGGILALGGLL